MLTKETAMTEATWYTHTTTDPRGSINLWVVFNTAVQPTARIGNQTWIAPWHAVAAVFTTEAEAQAYLANANDPTLEIMETATGIPPRGEGREVLPSWGV
jgi:hypothetical protein